MKHDSPTPSARKRLLLTLAVLPLLAIAAHGQNVLLPTDPIVASSANSPGSEGVKNAIDGTQSKYLNFDSANGAKTSGFTVTPSVGATWVTGMAIQTANDGPERDPKDVTLEGSNDGTNWTLVAQVQFPTTTVRFQWQTVTFTNYSPYTSYRWTVIDTQTTNTCCMQVAEVQLLGQAVPNNVLVPSDPIIASSANSPGSEGVKNAIDGTQAKYLNFDSANGAKTSGFVVTPQAGSTVAQGLAMQSANDAPERDPKTVTLEGSNDDVADYTTGTWSLITTVNVPAYASRFQWQTFLFPNVVPYKHYRWTVIDTQTTNTCCMQVAEVQILGTGTPVNALLPGDPIIASSSNSPGSEGVKNAIDGTQAKYLNFDSANGAKTSGFAVTPSAGATTITGLGIQSANDAPERDPKDVTIEGSNDDIADYTVGTWTLITQLQVPAFTNRFEWQYFYFANTIPYKHFRWTVIDTQTTNTCCMQVAEVQLLAVTAKADCTKAAFVSTPIDTPVLPGSAADLFVEVNGPWPLQWYTNGVAVPGGNKSTLTTDPITSANASIAYTVAIVGCQTSPPIHTVLFTPSTTKSIGIQFAGGGANGAPTYIRTNDIVGVQQQAYWNSAINSTGDLVSGTITNGLGNTDALTDSDGNTNAITFSYATSGTWGAGVNANQPVGRLLNGLTGAQNPTQGDQVLTFHNVPQGSHAVLIYSISPPLQFQNVKFAITNQNLVIYQRTMNSDEYKPAPGFYRSTSTDVNKPSIGNFVRFDGVHPDANGDVTVVYNVLTAADRQTGVDAIQLVLNAPNPGSPPAITSQPQPTAAPDTGVLTLSVAATGNGLTYQWRKDGVNLSNGGSVSGAQSATLTISPFSADDEGVYSVAIFNQAGSTISGNAAAYVSKYQIVDQMSLYYKFDETSGTSAANSVSGGLPATLLQGNLTWGPGKVANASGFAGDTTLFLSNYTKASKALSGSAWANIPAGSAQADMVIFRNQEGDFQFGGTANRILGQFELIIQRDSTTGNFYPSAVVSLGNNFARVTGSTPFPFDSWHNVAFTADGAQLRLYVDAVQVGSIDYTGDINPVSPGMTWISIGSRVATQTDTNAIPPLYILDPSAPDVLTGNLDELALWNRPLTTSEITGIYQAGSTNQPLTVVQETPPVVVTPATLTSSLSGSNLTISWSPAGGHLEASPTIGSGVTWTSLSTTNPSVVPVTGEQRYFRVVKP
jgi:hypothetical protein